MSAIKKSAINIIKKLPENCTIEDIQYELYFKSKVEKGLQDIKVKNILSEKEMDKEISSWQK